jgi:hypothetical protein
MVTPRHLSIRMAGLLNNYVNIGVKKAVITISDCRCVFDERPDDGKLAVILPFEVDKLAFIDYLYEHAYSPITPIEQRCWEDAHYVIIPRLRNDLSIDAIFTWINLMFPGHQYCLDKKQYHYELKFDYPLTKMAEFVLRGFLMQP